MSARALPTPPRRARTTGCRGPKDALDKFYTKPDVASSCLERLDLRSFARIIEPSAGSGAFSDQLLADPALDVVALDLAPENAHVRKQDWFGYGAERAGGPVLVVGNPPYGRQSSLALRFINHAFETVGADTVAFVLPRGFRKDSVKNRVFRNAALADELILPPNSFTLHGLDYDLPAVFQVWQRTNAPRPLVTGPLTSAFASFVSKQDGPEFAVRRVGGRAGHAYVPSADSSPQSNYFLRLRRDEVPAPLPKVPDVIDIVNALEFPEAEDGTGPKTLSKREFVARFDAALVSFDAALAEVLTDHAPAGV